MDYVNVSIELIRLFNEGHDALNNGNEEVLEAELLNIHKSVFENLNYSLLSGEYISNVGYVDQINNFHHELDSLLENFALVEDIQKTVVEVVTNIKIAVDLLSLLSKEITNKYSLNQTDYLFSINPVFSKNYQQANFSRDIQVIKIFFSLNVRVAEFDHFLSEDNEQLKNLYRVIGEIKENTPNGFNDLQKILIAKCTYLIVKWIARKYELRMDKIKIDGREESINHEIESYYSSWYNSLIYHYELISEWKSRIAHHIADLKGQNLNLLNIGEIHKLIKYYKDISPNQKKLKEISEYLIEVFKQKCSATDVINFDKYAYGVIVNYAINNQFSLFLENNKNIEEIKLEYIRLKDDRSPNIYNFFLEYKYLGRIIDLLNEKVEKENSLKYIELYEEYITTEIKETLSQYSFNNNWAINHYNYIFQLPFKECLLELSDNEKINKIFIASSFVLPPSRTLIEEQHNEIKRRFDNLIVLLNTLKGLKVDLLRIEELKSEVSSQKEEIKNREIKSMEVLGIFTALVTFVMGSISTFKFIQSAWQALLFVIALSVSLILFVFTLFLLNRGIKVIKSHLFALGGLFVLSLFFWTGIIYLSDPGKATVYQRQNEVVNKPERKVSKFKNTTTRKAGTSKN